MGELTDLELNKKIAEIDGVRTRICGGVTCILEATGSSLMLIPTLEYNPLTDWNITGPLIGKYDIDIEKCHNKKVGYSTRCGLIHETDLNLQRAILLAIVAKFEAVK